MYVYKTHNIPTSDSEFSFIMLKLTYLNKYVNININKIINTCTYVFLYSMRMHV